LPARPATASLDSQQSAATHEISSAVTYYLIYIIVLDCAKLEMTVFDHKERQDISLELVGDSRLLVGA